MNIPSMQDLLEAGVHFGHQVRRWHPSMKPFIFGAKDGVHIIDLAQTVSNLEVAYNFVKDLSSKGGKVIFLATKKQAREIIKEEAQKAGTLFITDRWIGGLITNFEEVSKNIKKMINLEEKRKNEEEMKIYTKKETVLIDREITKLERLYGGLRELEKLPAAIFIVDVKREETAAKEAKKREVPVVAIADTNANLDLIDYPVPGNDDSIKSIRIITQTIANAVSEGRTIYERGGPPREEGIASREEGTVEETEEPARQPSKPARQPREKAKNETESAKAKKEKKSTKPKKVTKEKRETKTGHKKTTKSKKKKATKVAEATRAKARKKK